MTALYEDSEGNLWAGEMGSLWRWKPGPPKHYALSDPSQVMYALTGSDDGGILVARRNGITKLKDGKIEAYARAAGPEFKPASLLRDHHGGVWIGAVVDKGLLRVHDGKTDLFTPADGLSGGAVSSLLEDFEGNIWVATVDGLDRFRDFAIPTISVEQGLSSRGVDSILAASDGSVWLGTSDGLNRWNQGQVTIYRGGSRRAGRVGDPFGGPGAGRTPQTRVTVREITDRELPEDAVNLLFEDELGQLWVGTSNGVAIFRAGRFFRVESVPLGFLYSITGDHAGNVWISHQEGLFRLAQSRVVQRVPWARLGRREPATALVLDPVQGGLWLGFRDGGAAYLENDRLRASYSGSEGMGGGMVGSFYMDGNHTLWVATEGGLSRIKDGRVLTLTSQNGLPCNMVHWMIEDDARSVWLHLACGVVRIPRSELDAWVSDPKRRIGPTLFDSSEGVRSLASYAGADPVVAKTADGKLWFRPFGGVSVIDPRHLAFNAMPPPVHIEQVVADGKAYVPSNGLRLPRRVRDVAIDFTALSLVAPEKVHFKYMLEGQDPHWKEFINERHAQYTNLSPRNYRFRVIASNNSGVWNEQGASLDFSVAPAYYQTRWFLASLAALFLAMLWAAYQARIQRLKRGFKQLRDVVETIPAMAWTARPDGTNEFMNKRWAEFTGLSAEDTAGSGWMAAVHPEDRQILLDKWRASLNTGEPLEFEARVRSAATGEYRWLLARGVPMRDAHGNILRWHGILTDIQDRKQAEEERERRRQLETHLAHLSRVSMMGELTASIAHEVNQPLTGIVSNGSACLRWLAGDPPNVSEVREAVGDIVRDGKRAAEVIARIRALSRRSPLPSENLNLNETIREVLVLVEDKAKRDGVRIRTQFAGDLSPVSGDRVQLQQVVLNLVMNGIEALSSVDQRARGLLISTANINGNQVLVTVKDSGAGVDPDAMAKIFEPFYTTKSGGMGMGLSICRSIVQNHGGRLWASANDGSGATFQFSLPKHREEGAHV